MLEYKGYIGEMLDDAMVAIEHDNRVLAGVLPKDYARPELDWVRLGRLISGAEQRRGDDSDPVWSPVGVLAGRQHGGVEHPGPIWSASHRR